jgi:tetratricopeptide (TPR) repeat protein/predicted Ser/Thr protein kinase
MFESGLVDVEAEPLEAPELQRGGTLSRYLLVDRVGAGGMGVVWAAYDPELDRKVAIKLLRPRRSEGRIEEARARLVREAQAMARLNHPNVIAVHDVGEHGGQVFVAMEFVEGRTLGRWVRNTRRSWREIVAMFVQAGRGLAEAHRAGIVHRDFKPDNVLIGEGRARVTDFGLARSVEAVTYEGETSAGESSTSGAILDGGSRRGQVESSPALVTPLTRTGIMLGTPAYMAPEQFDSGQFDARSDQFSFCVALWEALYGQRPFAGRTITELGEAVMAGRISEPPGDLRVPGFVERALRRGLSVDPERRWSSMDELLEELQHDPALGRRRWLVAGGLVASFGAAVILTPMFSEPQAAAVDPCPDPSPQLDGVWDERRRAEIEAAVLRSGVDDPNAAWGRIAGVLDEYAASWVSMREDACEATHVRGEQSEQLLDLRMQCLDARRVELEVATELLAGGDPEVVGSATKLLAGLAPIEPCGRRAYLEASAPIPSDEALASEVARIRGELAQARARVEVGGYAEMIPVLRKLLEEAEATGYGPVRAEVLSELGYASGGTGEVEETRDLLERAIVESIRTGLDAQAARAGIELSYLVGNRLGEYDEGLRWVERVEAWHDRLDAAPLSRARIATVEASILEAKGDWDRAGEVLRETLQLLGVDESLLGLDALGPAEGGTATWVLGLLARYAYSQGEFRMADAFLDAGVKLSSRVYGPKDAQTELLRGNHGTLAFVLGDWPAALTRLERARPGAAAGREEYPKLHAVTLLRLLQVKVGLAEFGSPEPAQLEELEALAREAHAAALAAFPESSFRVSESWSLLGEIDRILGRFDAAAEKLARAEALLEGVERLEPDQALRVELAQARLGLARAPGDDARAQLEALLAKAEAGGPKLRPMVAESLAGLGKLALARGEVELAREQLERALNIWDELAPQGHPQAIPALELLAEIDEARATRLRNRAAAIREGLG